MKELLSGNAAIARGAYEAGAKVVSAYPGTPSTEVTEIISGYKEVYAEWAPNEKVALEVALGASVAGVRAMACMKHVGLNVAADPLFTAAYTGVSGGLVVLVADDPGMHSSQNEQDTRFYARSAGVPLLEPSDSGEALEFTRLSFELSEKYDTPVILRSTTRLAHGQSFAHTGERIERHPSPYVKNAAKYVMMPANARVRHVALEERLKRISEDFNKLPVNSITYGDKKAGIICSGVVYQYVKEALPDISVLKLGTVYPLPLSLIREFAKNVGELIVVEELEPFIENQLKANGISCRGKSLFSKQGELSVNLIRQKLRDFSKDKISALPEKSLSETALPVRPPVLCAGCPHRGVFYVLSKLKTTVFGDIGCYTLGALPPLSAVDTVICMGAGIGMAHGFSKAFPDRRNAVAVIGDSTFIHSGITGLIDCVYNKSNVTVLILDNSTTGMTGHQNHPATGKTIKEEETVSLDIEALCGVVGARVRVVSADDIEAVESAVKEETVRDGVSVIIVKKPCELLSKQTKKPLRINSACKRCRACFKIGCPAIQLTEEDRVIIRAEACAGCGLCKKLCKFGAMEVSE